MTACIAVSLVVYLFFLKNKADTYLDREPVLSGLCRVVASLAHQPSIRLVNARLVRGCCPTPGCTSTSMGTSDWEMAAELAPMIAGLLVETRPRRPRPVGHAPC